jgi:hypothetical protein
MEFGKKSTTSLLLETKNKSNSLPETTRVGEMPRYTAEKIPEIHKKFSNKPLKESSKFTLKSPNR